MATYYFKCSLCLKDVSARSKYYKRYLDKFLCKNETELSNHYVCRTCRIKRGETFFYRKKVSLDLQDYPKFSEIQGYISLEATKLKKLGINNELARQIFLDNVKSVLESEGITKYDFIINNNELKGLTLILPFVGPIIMNINTDKEIY